MWFEFYIFAFFERILSCRNWVLSLLSKPLVAHKFCVCFEGNTGTTTVCGMICMKSWNLVRPFYSGLREKNCHATLDVSSNSATYITVYMTAYMMHLTVKHTYYVYMSCINDMYLYMVYLWRRYGVYLMYEYAWWWSWKKT